MVVALRKAVNILVVDDRDENLLAVEAVLSDPGYRLVRARSGREALKEVLDQDFALILLDVVMPGVDGYETATLIRERPRSSKTPIIFLTANDWGAQHVFRGYTVGAVDYLVKPVPADVLRSKVAVFVELFNRQEALRIAQEELERTIAERTRELADTNVALSAEIEERVKIEKERVQLLRREQAARLEAERALELMPKTPPVAGYVLEGYAGATEVQIAMWARAASPDMRATARTAAERGLSTIERFAGMFPVGEPRAALCRGLYERVLGRDAKAAAAFERAKAAGERLEMPYEAALASVELGLLLGARHLRGTALLDQAYQTFDALGAAEDARITQRRRRESEAAAR